MMNADELAREYLTETDPNNKRDIIANLYRELKGMFYSICSKYKDYAETEDLMQECFFALQDALECYSPEYSFKAHIRKHITWHILRTLNRAEGQGGILAEYRRIRRYEEDYFMAVGRKPTDEQIALHFHTFVAQIQDIRKTAQNIKAGVSFDEEALEGITYAELIPGQQDIEEDALRAYTCERIRQAVKRLPSEERQLIEYRMRGGQYPKDPEERKKALKLKTKAYNRLRSDKELKSIAYEEGLLALAYSWHYHGTSHTEYSALKLAML